MKSELWWISVGGHKCEPARVLLENGRKTAYTIGCPDGIEVTDTFNEENFSNSRLVDHLRKALESYR